MLKTLNSVTELIERWSGRPARETIEHFAASPTGIAMRRDLDEKDLAVRVAARQKFDAVDARHERRGAAAGKADDAADRQLAAALDAVQMARDLKMSTFAERHAAGYARDTERAEAERALNESADARLKQLSNECAALIDRIRAKFNPVARIVLGVDGKSHITGNGPELDRADAAIRRVRDEANAMMLRALPRDEVTRFIDVSFNALAENTVPLEVFPFRLAIDGTFEEVRRGAVQATQSGGAA